MFNYKTDGKGRLQATGPDGASVQITEDGEWTLKVENRVLKMQSKSVDRAKREVWLWYSEIVMERWWKGQVRADGLFVCPVALRN